jgi:hypothetical protein
MPRTKVFFSLNLELKLSLNLEFRQTLSEMTSHSLNSSPLM